MSLHVELRHDSPSLDVRLVFPAGVITALVGPSGSGKTSVLRAIAGLLRPREGCIRFAQDTWFDHSTQVNRPTRIRPVGFVPQSYALFPHLNALGNVATALLHVDRLKRERRARELFTLVHIAGLEGRYPHELSGGQQQRVAVARALARDPAVMLLDEPFSAVDRSTRKRLYAELKRLHTELGSTMILVTHDLDEAAALASHLCLIHRGRIVQSGPTRQVLARPVSVEAARLLDMPNINEARVLESDAGAQLAWGPHVLELPDAVNAPLGSRIHWCIPAAKVLLHRVDRPSRGTTENPVPARIQELLVLGDDAHVRLVPEGLPHAILHMRLSLHVAERNRLAAGQRVTVSLLGAAVVPLVEPGVSLGRDANGDRSDVGQMTSAVQPRRSSIEQGSNDP
jgi:molybdate transport system ATP-binding protein